MAQRTFGIGAYPDSEMGSAKVSFAALLNHTCYYWPLLAESHQTQLFFGSMPRKGHVLGYRQDDRCSGGLQIGCKETVKMRNSGLSQKAQAGGRARAGDLRIQTLIAAIARDRRYQINYQPLNLKDQNRCKAAELKTQLTPKPLLHARAAATIHSFENNLSTVEPLQTRTSSTIGRI